jgi:peptidoglycan/LPS O-acetylase OafA/YrhL
MRAENAGDRIAFIDGLRAIAVLSVVLNHAFDRSLEFGQSFGVELFFVISGFCLSYPTLARLSRNGVVDFQVAAYAARRVVRIVPPYYFAILIALIFIRLGLAVDAAPLFAGVAVPHSFSFLDVLRQALFLDQNTIFATRSFWSLSIEFRWYFIFPIALWLWTKSPRAFIFVCAAAALGSTATRAFSIDLFCLPAFMSGIAAAHVHVYGNRLARFALPATPLLLTMALAKTGSIASPIWQLAVFALVVAAASTPVLQRILSLRWLVGIGVVSYSIYLVQEPVIAFAEQHGIEAVFAAMLAVVAGIAFWAVLERPFIQPTALRKRLLNELEAFLPRWFRAIGIGSSMALSVRVHRPEPCAEIPNDVEAASAGALALSDMTRV